MLGFGNFRRVLVELSELRDLIHVLIHVCSGRFVTKSNDLQGGRAVVEK